MKISIGLIAALLMVSSVAVAQNRGQGTPVQVKTTLLGGNVYGIDGQGARMAALVGPEGILLVDAQSPPVTDRIVAALKEISPGLLRFLVNTHVHADHTGGNENFGKLGVTILGRPNLLEQLVHPVPATNGQIPAPAAASALPIILFDNPVTISLDGETVQLIPLPPSHTNGDTAVKFVKANVLMTGDVFRSEGFPTPAEVNGGTIMGLLQSIEKFLEITDANTKVVPGHGPVSDRAALVFHREVILTVRDRVRQAIREGKTLDQVHDAKLTADFEARVGGLPAFINVFVDALYKELKAESRP
jgi:glyoxylase-like metal-dependent hydrolase (beta-lactamase superfamily II)